jgi:hypothetical protein
MNLKNVGTSTVALLVCGLFILATGWYTDNGGFQLAGALVLLAGVLRAYHEARGPTRVD